MRIVPSGSIDRNALISFGAVASPYGVAPMTAAPAALTFDRETAGGGEGGYDELAAGELGYLVHGVLPQAFISAAARWIARRMRT